AGVGERARGEIEGLAHLHLLEVARLAEAVRDGIEFRQGRGPERSRRPRRRGRDKPGGACDNPAVRRIGILGVGLLGTAVASRLLAKGFEVVGHDTRPAQVGATAGGRRRAAADLAETVAGSDAVFTILTTPDVVEAVWLRPAGALHLGAR